MSKKTLLVTSNKVTEKDGRKLQSVRLLIAGRSMWLNLANLPNAKLNSKGTELEVEDTEFNSDKFEVLKCANENGQYLKLVPKSGFRLAEF